ncbi:MAG TPA: YhcH/YjgK/YiaL family protein [Bacteroidales bacterium]|nr:YhcH/YjgK/YiaL family protein [Bacteroidales bacterium]
MKKASVFIIIMLSFLGMQSCNNSSDPSSWSEDKVNTWFESGKYLNGWSVKPDASVNKREFAIAYFNNKERWDKAFEYLMTTDLNALEVKRHDIDGDNLFALVSGYMTKNEEDAKFEAHKKYVDIQYVISGSEQMSVAPVTKKGDVLTPYDETKDLEFMTVTESSHYIATPDKFFLFFPSDLHRPSVKVGENAQVKKVVVKVKL